MKILIVEPKRNWAKMYCGIVESLGYRAEAVAWAREAFHRLKNETFEALVVSKSAIDMPGELMKHLFENTPVRKDLPLYVTASPENEVESLTSFLREVEAKTAGEGKGGTI